MHIDTAERGKREDSRRQDATECCDCNQVRFPLRQSHEKFGILHLERLEQRNLLSLSQQFHRRWGQDLPAPFGAIWLSDDTDDGIIRLEQGLKRSRSKIRSAHEDESHAIALALQVNECNLAVTAQAFRLKVPGKG